MKPVIGITCNYVCRDTDSHISRKKSARQDQNYLAVDYARAIEAVGGIPVMIPQCGDTATALALLEHLDGLLFSGGNDIAPSFYHEAIRDRSGTFVPQRDEMEIALVREAFRMKKPVLGICRGLQVMNVAFGGTMYQDLKENSAYGRHKNTSAPRWLPVHKVKLQKDTLLWEICQRSTLGVNSLHHQAVHTLPENATVCAVAADGLVESLSFAGGHPFTLGVQWHPEMMQSRSQVQRKIFMAFLAACQQ